jgi:hypothetical protein
MVVEPVEVVAAGGTPVQPPKGPLLERIGWTPC